MDAEYKKQSPYRGLWVILLMLICVPLMFFGVLYAALEFHQPYQTALNLASAKTIGFGLGAVFHLSCAVAGVFTTPLKAIFYRIGEFFENLVVSPSFAFESYWEDMKNDGVVFLIELPILVANLLLLLDGLLEVLPLL